MSEQAKRIAARGLLALALVVVGADWVLPTTLFFDELIMLGIVWAMRKVST